MYGETELFRPQARSGAADSMFGQVSAVLPPSGVFGALMALGCVVVLSAVLYFVRIPLKTEAAGVLMPVGGLVDVVALVDGRVESVHGRASATVASGETLFDVAVHSAVVDGVVSSRFRLQSMQREMDRLRDLRAARKHAFESQQRGLQEELRAIDRRQQLLDRQQEVQREVLAAAKVRFDRYRRLEHAEHVSRDELDRQRETLLREEALLAGIRQQAAAIGVERRSLVTRTNTHRREQEVSRAEFEIRMEQLSREVESKASLAHYSVRSPHDGTIESVLIDVGSFVRKGQVLARLSRGRGLLEAWLYLPGSRARSLRPGQTVELRLDAWSGTGREMRTATVYFVSSVPMAPGEVAAPLAVVAPVFEIRARLHLQPAPVTGHRWVIPPGTTFRAYVLQRQMRLYEWLFRNRYVQTVDRSA